MNSISVMIMLPLVIKAAVAWADWGKYLGDNTMATTILDRLMHRAQELEFEANGVEFHRHALRRSPQEPTPAP